MFVMSMLDRLTDVKKSTYAKIIAVLVSVAMVLSLTNMSAFAEGDGLSGIFGGNSDVVKVAVDLDNAKIEYGDQTVTNADKTFVASAGKDLKFKASAVTEDFTLDEVALVTTAENGSEVVTGLESIDGTYTIKADDVADGITIKASATEMAPAENQSIQETAAQAEQAPAKAARAGQWNNGNNYVTENINQNSVDKYPQGDFVFIFLKVNQGDNITGIADKYKYTDGSKVWYTYGYVQVDGLRTAEGYYDSRNDPKDYVENDKTTVNSTIDNKIKAGVGEDSITLLEGNSNVMFNGKPLDFNAAGFWSFGPLLAANKAQGVTASGAQTRTWHKNITLNDTRTVTVKYVDDKGKTLKDPDVTTVAKGGSYDVSNLIPDSISVNNKTYNRASNIDGNVSGTANDNVVITVQYSQKIRQYTVKFIDETTGEEIKGAETKEAPVNSRVPVKDEFVKIPGYNFSKVVINGQDNKSYSTITDDLEMVVQGSDNSEITFYYTKRTDLGYTVNYVELNEDGTTTKVADSKNVDNQTFGAEVTESAIDVAGYNKVNTTEQPSSLTFNVGVVTKAEDGTESVSNNEITFYYTKRTDLSYTVNYLEQGTDAVLHEAKTVNDQTFGDKATEQAIDIAGYNKVDPTEATITIAVENNVINFYYTKRTDLGYTVNYVELNEDGTTTKVADSKNVDNQTFGAEVTESAIDVAGYNKVNTTEQPSSLTFNVGVVTKAEDGTESVSNNEITFYYTKRTDLSYTVNYLEQGTDAVLHEAKTVNDQTFGDKATEQAIDIAGYNKVDPTEATITIAVENNVINFYYTKRTDLSYTVNYYFDNVLGDAPTGATTGGNAAFQDEVTIAPSLSVTVGENTYTLTSTEHKIASISANESENVINVYYELDNVVDPGEDPDPTQPGDGISDKYQAMALFTTADENQGTVGGDTTKVYTLRDAAGNLVESAEVELDADGVTTTAAEGHVFFNWTGAEFGAQTLKGNDVVTFVANWTEDAVGIDPANPDQGDGIPDMYQARVNFVAVNGSVDIPYTYVTLLDENGQPSENGTGYLTAEQIAVATAAEGYDQDSLAWDVIPTTENAITGEVTYTVTFTANQPVVPAGPDTPGTTTPTPAPAGPVPGAAPAALAPVAAALAAPVAALIGDEPTPLAEEAIGDEEDPLAAFDHVNCWVHYYMILGILLTLVYGGCVIARRSNYSRKIQKMDDYATGKAMDTVEETENVANAAAQKMEA